MCSKVLEKIRSVIMNFGYFEWIIYKLTLVLIGIILGTYFYSIFAKYINVLWVICAVGLIYIIYLLFAKKDIKNGEEEKEKNDK